MRDDLDSDSLKLVEYIFFSKATLLVWPRRTFKNCLKQRLLDVVLGGFVFCCAVVVGTQGRLLMLKWISFFCTEMDG